VKPLALSERLNDALSPIVVKELRQAVQSRYVTAMLLLFLIVQLVFMGWYVLRRAVGVAPNLALETMAGQDLFLFLQGVLLVTCMLVLPAYTGIRLAAERSDTNVDLLFITTLRPRAIVGGKFLASLVLAGLIFSACTPFMCFTFLLRGIDAAVLLWVVLLDAAFVATSVQLAILIAVFSTNRALKVIFGLLGFAVLCWMLAGAVFLTERLLHYGTGRPAEFWGNMLAVVPMGLIFLGLLYVWSVALVSPPSSNRLLPLRLYLLVAWVLSAPFFVASSYVFGGPDPLTGWIVLSGLLFFQGMLIAVNEREQWSPRVARQIPRRWWLRAVAFLLFSGAAGGVLFCSLMLALTYLAMRGWEAVSPLPPPDVLPHGQRAVVGFRDAVGMLSLYAYSYCLTAVFIRRLRFFRIKPQYTWLVALALMVMGSLLPLLLAFLWFFRNWNYETYYYWLLTNPVTAVLDTRHEWPYLCFVGCWAGLVTLLNLPWFARQVRAFRPYGSGPSAGGSWTLAGPEALDATKSVPGVV
jgi:hypothetical protein